MQGVGAGVYGSMFMTGTVRGCHRVSIAIHPSLSVCVYSICACVCNVTVHVCVQMCVDQRTISVFVPQESPTLVL